MSQHVSIVIPCYNEAGRLREDSLLPLLDRPDMRLVLVDDGSTDATESVLRELEARHAGRVQVLVLPDNVGKAEAVRQGLLHALAQGAGIVGYADADMATPAEELMRLLDVLEQGSARCVIGARVTLLGTDIRRKHSRHYFGRVFATFASLTLDAPVYDTQCGAKLFRRTPDLQAALAMPFRSRWAFDVELLGRLMVSAGDYRTAGIVEVPLRRWIDIKGSKITPSQMVKAGLDLATIAWDLRRLRRRRDPT